jgi:hypothetical protein
LVICQERIPRQFHAQLPGDILGWGLQEGGPGTKLLEPGEGLITCPRKLFDFAEALVRDEATGRAASGDSPRPSWLAWCSSLMTGIPVCNRQPTNGRRGGSKQPPNGKPGGRHSMRPSWPRFGDHRPKGELGGVLDLDRLCLERVSSRSLAAKRWAVACSAATRRAVASHQGSPASEAGESRISSALALVARRRLTLPKGPWSSLSSLHLS